jgi:hypothetical protein
MHETSFRVQTALWALSLPYELLHSMQCFVNLQPPCQDLNDMGTNDDTLYKDALGFACN